LECNSHKENEQETIEKGKIPVRYEISPHLSIKKVLQDTHAMFLASDTTFLIVSKEDPSIVIRNATDFDKFSAAEMKKYFPANLVKQNAHIALFIVTDRSLHRLKKDSSGFYSYAAKHIYISHNAFLSSDVRNLGFFLRKSAAKVDKEKFTDLLTKRLQDFPLSTKDSVCYNEAKEALPFDGPLPNFALRVSNNLYHANATGRVRTTAITFHCDHKHAAFLSRILISFYESPGRPHEQFVFIASSMELIRPIKGTDPTNKKAYQNAIILQNEYLTDLRILPVIGISPKALEQQVSVFNGPSQSVHSLLLQYKLFTSLKPTTKSEELGMYFFVTTGPKFDKAKQFIIETVPKIWAKLDNTFLNELPHL
jgi:hypothetical protein